MAASAEALLQVRVVHLQPGVSDPLTAELLQSARLRAVHTGAAADALCRGLHAQAAALWSQTADG